MGYIRALRGARGGEAGEVVIMGNHPDDIGIVEVADDGVDELLRLYAVLFHDREPLTRWIGFGKERMISMARAMHASDGDGVAR